MEKQVILFFLCFSFIFPIEENIINSVYNLAIDSKNILVYKDNNFKLSNSDYFQDIANFRIIKNYNNEYYNIELAQSNFKLSASPGNLKMVSRDNLDNVEWSFIKSKNNKYIIKNKNECYIILTSNKITCKNSIKEAIKFNLIKVYDPVNHSEEDLKLIEKEPIDVLIKYIDLSDPTLVREGIPQIKKDEDNEELKYNIRSIMKNIPWVRKIYIVMPNKKVRFFKDYELIKDKIVYVSDKDVLGHESSNSVSFQFSFWVMERFNISKNYILMDDDCFIGKPLKKSDLFYVENGKVVPAIVSTKFNKYSLESVINLHQYYKKRLKNKQTTEDFYYSLYKGYIILLKMFKHDSIFPEFTHNAIPCNIDEVKEIYNIVYNSEYKYATLDSIYRHIECLQFQSFYLAYTFVKNNQKVNPVANIYIDVGGTFNADYNYSLFCINTGAHKYSNDDFMKAKIAMEYKFPEPTPYEIINYKNIPDLAFNIIYQMNKKEEKLTLKFVTICIITGILSFIIVILIIFIFICFKKKRFTEYDAIPEQIELIKDKKSKYSDINMEMSKFN